MEIIISYFNGCKKNKVEKFIKHKYYRNADMKIFLKFKKKIFKYIGDRGDKRD